MEEIIFIDKRMVMENLLTYIPTIKRSRGYRIYDQNGISYLDCYLQNGRFLYGYRPANRLKILKNAISTGSLQSYPTIWSKRLAEQVERTFPSEHLFLFENRSALDRFLRDQPSQDSAGKKGFKSESGLPLWRPSMERPDGSFVELLLPWVSSYSFIPVLAKNKIPRPSSIPNPLAAQSLIYGLNTFFNPLYPPEGIAIKGPWEKVSIYLKYIGKLETYKDIFLHFLGNRILISPDPAEPTLFPLDCSPGELQRFNRAMEVFV